MAHSLLAIILLPVALLGQNSPQQRAEWNQPVKPFRIIGNIYYVGAANVSSFFIKTADGAILLDGGLPETAPLIEKNIASLGFSIADVKFLLNSHAHYDHCGGLAELKKLSNARMIASERDRSVLVSGQGQFGSFPPVTVDRVIADRQTVQLGGITLTAHLTPGHTKGCTTWTMPVSDGGKTLQVVFYCSTSVVDKLVNNSGYPGIVSDYMRSFAELHKLPCDVFLAPHAGFFRLDEKRKQLEAGKLDAFIDPTEMQKFVKESEQDFRKQLDEQIHQ
ncbi:MAG TPA: subclass B3 metallo-beta-lactamase [Bryobacteraceae bacterium]|nr:subclass B3 metallo-beta-lactamase [Bryobacteraceae bacterium]